MISTVTTSTVATMALAAFGGGFAVIGVIFLLGMLVQKELASSWDSARARKFSKYLTIGIIPLLIAFMVVVGVKILEVLQ